MHLQFSSTPKHAKESLQCLSIYKLGRKEGQLGHLKKNCEERDMLPMFAYDISRLLRV